MTITESIRYKIALSDFFCSGNYTDMFLLSMYSYFCAHEDYHKSYNTFKREWDSYCDELKSGYCELCCQALYKDAVSYC